MVSTIILILNSSDTTSTGYWWQFPGLKRTVLFRLDRDPSRWGVWSWTILGNVKKVEIMTTINRTYSSVTQHVDTAGTMLPFASTWTQFRFLWDSISMIRSLFTYITIGYNYTTTRTRQIRVILLFCDDSDTRQPNKTLQHTTQNTKDWTRCNLILVNNLFGGAWVLIEKTLMIINKCKTFTL
jgi:hypothetical protein